MRGHRGTRNRRQQSENGTPLLDISSLIDVSFLLLIYFLITSTLDPKEADLPSFVSAPMPGAPATIDLLEIGVDPDGIVSAQGEVLDSDAGMRDLPELRTRLSEYAAAWKLSEPETSPKVVVRADDNAEGQRFIDVMNCLAGVGISDVILEGFADR